MKPYSEYPHAGIEMKNDSGLKAALRSLSKEHIDVIVESGTFNGLGSTTFLSEAFKHSQRLKALHTIELNYSSYREARSNLEGYSFVHCHYGCSVEIKKAILFIEQDEAIKGHDKYPHVFIDDLTDPVSFYTKELRGHLGMGKLKKSLNQLIYRESRSPKENLITKLAYQYPTEQVLIALDSSGGMGWMEFQHTLKVFSGRMIWLMLDDTHHLKHFRSKEFILNDRRFEVLYENEIHGSMLVAGNLMT